MFSYALLLHTLGRYPQAEPVLREAFATETTGLLEAHLHRYLGINLVERGDTERPRPSSKRRSRPTAG